MQADSMKDTIAAPLYNTSTNPSKTKQVGWTYVAFWAEKARKFNITIKRTYSFTHPGDQTAGAATLPDSQANIGAGISNEKEVMIVSDGLYCVEEKIIQTFAWGPIYKNAAKLYSIDNVGNITLL